MGTYFIERNSQGVECRFDGAPLTHVVHHSPTGFEYGYGGSGPADLALSILAHHFGVDTDGYTTRLQKAFGSDLPWGEVAAWTLHNPFKFAFLAGEARGHFTLTTETVEAWVLEQIERGDCPGRPS